MAYGPNYLVVCIAPDDYTNKETLPMYMYVPTRNYNSRSILDSLGPFRERLYLFLFHDVGSEGPGPGTFLGVVKRVKNVYR